MENIHYDFTESTSGDVFAMQQLNAGYVPEPGDEDDDETDLGGDEEPSLDEDVVHSPLPTDNGGKPKS